MKTNIKLSLALFALAGFSLTMTACEDLFGPKDLSAEDAKIELRAAGDDISYNLGMMMESPPMVALSTFGELSGLEISLKSEPGPDQARQGRFLSAILASPANPPLPGVKQLVAIARHATAEKATSLQESGVFQYNFNTGYFDLVNGNVSYLEYRFPDNDSAYAARQNNCVLRIEDLVVVTVEDEWGDEEEVPTRFDAYMTIDGEEVMDATYRLTLNNAGMPVSTSIQMNMDPYSMDLNFSGSNRDYSLVMSLKLDDSILLSTDLDIRYTADQEEVESLDGVVEVSPLKFDGEIFPLAIEECYEEEACMNDNIDVEVIQTELNKRIGILEFRMYYDPYWEEEYLDLAIVYEDGTYEFLNEVFGEFDI